MRFVLTALLALAAPVAARAAAIGPVQFAIQMQYPATVPGLSETPSITPPLVGGTIRIWDSCSSGSSQIAVTWAAIETSQGVYDTTNLDACVDGLVAKFAPTRMIYTLIGMTPQIYRNGGASNYGGTGGGCIQLSQYDPNFYAFVQFIAAHLAARYPNITRIYEEANEPDSGGNSASAFANTDPACGSATDNSAGQVVGDRLAGLYTGMRPYIRAGDPAGLIMMGSPTSTNSISYMLDYFARGLENGTDFGASHAGYLIPAYYTNGVFGMQNVLQTYANVSAAYGYTKPWAMTEGSFGTSSSLGTQLSYASLMCPIALLNGLDICTWYRADALPLGTGWGGLLNGSSTPVAFLNNGGLPLNLAGLAFRRTQKWLMGATMVTPFKRAAGTNLGPSWGSCSGASFPANITASVPGNGMTVACAGSGTEGSTPYLDAHVTGTASTSFGMQLYGSTNANIAASANTWYTVRSYARFTQNAGTTPITTYLFWVTYNSGSSVQTQTQPKIYLGTSAATIDQQANETSGLTNSSTITAIRPTLQIQLVSGQTYDFTVRFYFTLDASTRFSGTFTKANGCSYEMDADFSGSQVSYAPNNSTYPWREDIWGRIMQTPANDTLDGYPVLYKSAQNC